MAFNVENLKVYQRAVDFADAIITTTQAFPRGYYFISDQLNRASTSIAANIAEGNGRFTKADRKHFFVIARGSVHECLPLLELAARRSLIKAEKKEDLVSELEEMSRMLAGLIQGTDHRRSAPLSFRNGGGSINNDQLSIINYQCAGLVRIIANCRL